MHTPHRSGDRQRTYNAAINCRHIGSGARWSSRVPDNTQSGVGSSSKALTTGRCLPPPPTLVKPPGWCVNDRQFSVPALWVSFTPRPPWQPQRQLQSSNRGERVRCWYTRCTHERMKCRSDSESHLTTPWCEERWERGERETWEGKRREKATGGTGETEETERSGGRWARAGRTWTYSGTR